MTFNPAEHLTRLSGKDYLEVKWRLVWLRDVFPDASIETQLLSHEPEKYATVKATIMVNSAEKGAFQATGHGYETKQGFGDYLEKAETKALGRALAALGFGTQNTDDFDRPEGRPVDSPVSRGQNGGNGYSSYNNGGAARATTPAPRAAAPQQPGRAAQTDRSTAATTRPGADDDHWDAVDEVVEQAGGHLLDEARRLGATDAPTPLRQPAQRSIPASSATDTRAPLTATEPQIKAMRAIARQVGTDAAAEAHDRYGVALDALTRRQASELIDALKAMQGN